MAASSRATPTRCAQSTTSRSSSKQATRSSSARGRANYAGRGRQSTVGIRRARGTSTSNRQAKHRRTTAAPSARTTRSRSSQATITKSTQRRATKNANTTKKNVRVSTRQLKQTHAEPSDDAIRVCVYQLVLSMPAEQWATLGVRALRTQVEQSLGLSDGELKQRREIIATTAANCVRAVVDAERRVMEALPAGAMDEATRANVMQMTWMNNANVAEEEDSVQDDDAEGHSEGESDDAMEQQQHHHDQGEMEEDEEVRYSTQNVDGGASPGETHIQHDHHAMQDGSEDEQTTEQTDLESSTQESVSEFDADNGSANTTSATTARAATTHDAEMPGEGRTTGSAEDYEERDGASHMITTTNVTGHTGSPTPVTSTPPPPRTSSSPSRMHISPARPTSLSPVVSHTNDTSAHARSVTPPRPINRQSCSPRLTPTEGIPEQNPFVAYSAYPAY